MTPMIPIATPTPTPTPIATLLLDTWPKDGTEDDKDVTYVEEGAIASVAGSVREEAASLDEVVGITAEVISLMKVCVAVDCVSIVATVATAKRNINEDVSQHIGGFSKPAQQNVLCLHGRTPLPWTGSGPLLQ